LVEDLYAEVACSNLILWTLALAPIWRLASHAAPSAEAPHATCHRSGLHERGRNRHGELFARTELFFGGSKTDGSLVTDEEFRRFLDEEITPSFPNGLTLVSGSGQFRGSSGMIMREDSVLLILLYSAEDDMSSERIDQIRDSYKQAFQQESVLRVDSRNCVSF
jgi:hypothetical protein